MVTLICKQCGKEFSVIPCRQDTAKYCSKHCANAGLHGENNCICEVCGKEFHRKPYHMKRYKHRTCSKTCMNLLKSKLYTGEGNHQYGLRGPLNASFNGLEITRKNNNLNDIKVYSPDHPHKDKDCRVSKHRLLVEKHYELFDLKYFEKINNKIVLKRTSHVHHINGNHDDNRIENLIPVTKSEHKQIHAAECEIIRDKVTGRITGVLKRGELLEKPEEVNQQPSQPLTKLEGSETND